MKAKAIAKFLKNLKWNKLCNIYGSAHPSIIGFISYTWINQSQYNTVLDGAPSSSRGHGRRGQNNADLLLCRQKKPYIVVEVESGVSNYQDKIETIQKYLENTKEFNGLRFGLLIMTDMYDLPKGKTCWDIIRNKIKKIKFPIALVFIEKKKIKPDNSPLGILRKLNTYYPKDVVAVDYWIHTSNQDKKGTLYRKK